MKFIRSGCLWAVFLGLWLTPFSEHPPPTTSPAPAGYAALSATNSTSCGIDPNFLPVAHVAQAYFEDLLARLAPVAGFAPEEYTVEMMRDLRGRSEINAMTCPDSRLIWVSVSAWEQLANYEPAIILLLAHELAHADLPPDYSLYIDEMLPAERQLLGTISDRQMAEVLADRRAADIMAAAGYSAQQINQASWYILARDASGNLGQASATHPAGRDRANLLTYYLARRYLSVEDVTR